MNARTLLPEMVAIPSVSRDEGAIAEYLAERMNEMGFDARIDEAGNAVGVRRGESTGAEQREIVLLGHMDTVPGEVPVRIEGDLLYGRGSVDAKAPLAAFVLAVANVEPAPDVTLTVIGAVEEEVHTSRGARHVRPLHRPEACIIGEPSSWDAVTLGYKGSLNLDYCAQQPGGHGAGPQGAVGERACAFWQGLQAFAAEHDEGREKLFELLMPSIKSIATSSDGLTDTVRATFGFRLPPEFDVAALEARAAELSDGAELSFYGHEPAWSSERTTPLARAFAKALRQHDVRPRFKHKTGTSDMNVLGPEWQCPIVAYGPGDSLLDHTPNEHVSLSEVERAVEVLRSTLAAGGWAVG